MQDIHQINKLDEMLIYLNSLHPKYIDFNLDRIKKLMKKLGNPEKKLPLVVHIAGTNGKGSTLSFIKHIAEEQGLKVNCYLSPHLIKFNERIIVNSQVIEEKILFKMLKKVALKNNNSKITFFEITTAVAFLVFSKFKSDICIIETGLGGKLDATNILEKKDIVALTKIGFDHKEFLGNSLRQITLEKCGILKKSTPVVIGQQRSKFVENLIIKQAEIKQSPQIKRLSIPRNWKLGLSGDHQYNNAEIAFTVMKTICKDIKCSTIKKGLYKTQWPGRLQTISNGKLFSDRQNITLIDGAHNIDGAIVINDHLKALNLGKWTIILGMMNNKNVLNFINKIEKHTDMIFLIPIENQINSFTTIQLSKKLKKFDFHRLSFNSLEQAISQVPKDKPLLITGSLYLMGEILAKN